MTRKVKLANVLWEAANTWLHPSESFGWAREIGGRCSYSCHAIQAAVDGEPPNDNHSIPGPVADFLETLGCNGSAAAGKTLNHNQSTRYMWLLLAMHVAEDEGIEIEVAA